MSDVPTLSRPALRKRQQVAQSLRDLTRTMAPGERLPSVLELERQLGVATGTIKAAVEMLRREGLVVSRARSGTYIAERPAPAAGNTGPFHDRRQPGASAGVDTLAVLALYNNPYFQYCVDRLTALAAETGLAVVCRYADHELTLDGVLALEALHPTGFLVFSHELHWAAAALIEREHRSVVVGVPRAGVSPSVPCVYGDHEHGGFLATRHVLQLGHRRLLYAHLFGADEQLFATRRWRGHERALGETGAGEVVDTIRMPTIYQWGEDAEAVRSYFGRNNAPTAIVAWSDSEAFLLLTALQRAGLRVPRDVSVVGYDNLPGWRNSYPTLDTVDQHIDLQIRHALWLLGLPAPPETRSTTVVTPTLVRRESSAVPQT